MPNWCNNSITIKGSTETIKTLWEEANREGEDGGLLNAMVPMPVELRDTTKGSNGDAVNWYDWAVANWGTKWDVSLEGLEFTDNGDGTATIEGWFDSAWAHPLMPTTPSAKTWTVYTLKPTTKKVECAS